MGRSVSLIALWAVAFFAVQNTAEARVRVPRIERVEVLPSDELIRIEGRYFGDDPIVRLGNQDLTVLLATDELVEAELPASVEPGTYPL
ncbi:MAG: hypothetical protein R3344_10240, partial [Acidobacteriota bacterium]|nr:hypothetical protein [Acidobacteriota bacterium]